MSALSALLAQPRLSLITRTADRELAHVQATVTGALPVDGRGELDEVIGRLLACDAPPTPKTLDLIGHTTADEPRLQLGNWVIDAADALTRAIVRELGDHDAFSRLGVTAVRLVGSRTAATASARQRLATLTSIAGVEVQGTSDLVHAADFDAHGLREDADVWFHGAHPDRARLEPPVVRGIPIARWFDVDAMAPLILPPADRRVVDAATAREIVELIDRREGVSMPGLLASPSHELALPSSAPGAFYLAHVLLDAELIRVYPDGLDRPSVLFPISAPPALRRLLAASHRDDRHARADATSSDE
jgi:hypothetical protein